jgi:phenylacetate-CoA ligase
MRIALVIEALEGGGAERVVRRLAPALAAAGQRVFVYCLQQAGTGVDELQSAGVTVRELHSVGRDLGLGWRLRKLLRADAVQVVHAHSCAAFVWCLPVARSMGRPVIHVRHGSLLGKPTPYVRLAYHLDHLADRVVVVSESDRQRLPRRLQRRAAYVPDGIDLPAMAPGPSRQMLEKLCKRSLNGPVLLSVGTLCREKDLGTLLRSFVQVREQYADAQLVVIGGERTASYGDEIRRAQQSLGLADEVLFTGPVPDAWRFMAGADALVLSSVTEALPNVVIEAMSQGVPVVATTVGDVGRLPPDGTGEHWILGHGETGLLVPPRQPDVMAAAICQTLADPVAAQDRADRAADEYSARFTADRMAAGYLAVYHAATRAEVRKVPRARPPRVLMIGPPKTAVGGMRSVVNNLVAGPLRDRAEITTFAPRVERRAPGSRQDDSLLERFVRLPSSVLRHLASVTDLIQAIRTTRTDIVHVHTCSGFSYYRSGLDAFAARLMGCGTVLHIHGGRFREFCESGIAAMRWLRRRIAESADGIVVLSPFWKRSLRPHVGNAAVYAIPNGVAVPPQCPTKPKQTCRIVFLGAVRPQKGVAELLEAAARLRAAGPPFDVTIAGPPEPSQAHWEARAAAAGATDYVRFIGPVHGADKDALLTQADILVLPSRIEALPLVVLEAAAAGCAIVATQVGSIPEIIPRDADGQWVTPLVPVGDVPALTDALAGLIEDPSRRREIGRTLHTHVAGRYSAETVAAQVHRLYEHLMPGTKSRTAQSGAGLVRWLSYPLHEALCGRPTMRELRELERAARLAPDDARADAQERLTDLLRFAHEELSYYQQQFRTHVVLPGHPDALGELRKLPALSKADVRAHAEGMCAQHVPGGAVSASSGGTSGDTLYFQVDRLRQAQDLAARLFMQRRFGIEPGERRVYLWGSPIEVGRSRLHYWRDRLLNELLLSAFHLTPAVMDAHLARMERFGPAVLYGYTSAVTALARHAATGARRWKLSSLRLVVVTGEESTPAQLAQIRATFGCAVAREYGNREVGLIAHDCPQGQMHVIAPHVQVDVLQDGSPAAPGETGEIVCTHLNTRAQPMLRYRVGDAGALPAESCTCGLPWPVLELQGGKLAGFLALPDGRLCHGAVSSHAVQGIAGLVTFRTHQDALDHITVSLVVDDEFEPASTDLIRRRYRDLFGTGVQVDVRIVDDIPPDPSGKRRHVVSDVAPDYTAFEIVNR